MVDRNPKEIYSRLRGIGIFADKDYDWFSKTMSDPAKAKKLYGMLSKDNLLGRINMSGVQESEFVGMLIPSRTPKKQATDQVVKGAKDVDQAAPTQQNVQTTSKREIEVDGILTEVDLSSLMGKQVEHQPELVRQETLDNALSKENIAEVAWDRITKKRGGDMSLDAITISRREIAMSGEDPREGMTLKTSFEYDTGLLSLEMQDISVARDYYRGKAAESLGVDDPESEYIELRKRGNSLIEAFNNADEKTQKNLLPKIEEIDNQISRFEENEHFSRIQSLDKLYRSNLDAFKSLKEEDKYKIVLKRLEDAEAREKARHDLKEGSLLNLADWNIEAYVATLNVAAQTIDGFGKLARALDTVDGKRQALDKLGSGFERVGEFLEEHFPVADENTRAMFTKTGTIDVLGREFEVDFDGDRVASVRRDGRTVDIELTDEQVKEARKSAKEQVNWNVSAYKMFNGLEQLAAQVLLMRGAGRLGSLASLSIPKAASVLIASMNS